VISRLETDVCEQDFTRWIKSISLQLPEPGTSLLEQAWNRSLGILHHSGASQQHAKAVSVAGVLAELGVDPEVLAVPFLCVAMEAGGAKEADLGKWHGERVAHLVGDVYRLRAVGKLGAGDGTPPHDQQLEGLRKLLLSVMRDVRVILVVLAERLQQLRQLSGGPEPEQSIAAREALDIYAPLANRLAIGQIKWQLEDLAFRYLEPDRYKMLARRLAERRTDREGYVVELVAQIRAELDNNDIHAEVHGRAKHLYSIWRKMQRKQLRFEQLFDVLAVRVVAEDVPACYAALGAVHALWLPITQEFDDYIANPKLNGYQSLHTAVIGPAGRRVEIQIRTHSMHEACEFGIAAHWRYKEGSGAQKRFDERVAWLRQLLDTRDDSEGNLLDRFRAEAFEDRVYVLTPRGDVLDLPKGSTPLDFAYKLHSDVGHRCRGAKVDGRIVPLTHELSSGVRVEILTARHGGPSRDWLNPNLGYLKSARARAKVRHWFRQADQEHNVSAGRGAVERELSRLGLRGVDSAKVAARLRYATPEQLYAAVGFGDVTVLQVIGAAQEQAPSADTERHALFKKRPQAPRRERARDIEVNGVGSLLTHMAQCCKPAPPEPIIGFITVGRGVTIHRQECRNGLNLVARHPDRIVEVSWGDAGEGTYPVDIRLRAVDRPGLLRDVTTVLAQEQVNIAALNTVTDSEDMMVTTDVTIEVREIYKLSRVLDKLGQIHNVLEVGRRH